MNRRRPALICLAAALLFAIYAGRADAQGRSSMNVPPPLLLDVLNTIPFGTGPESREAEQTLDTLRLSFERARQSYEAGHYRLAAERFMDSAREAFGQPDSYTRAALAVNRASCYRNAARAWYMASALAGERARLEEAAREDPSCADDVQQILELLGDGDTP